MRLQPSTYFNFNQMLVVSVFLHLVTLTVMFYLPRSEEFQQKIRPVFMVDLVELPALTGSQPTDLEEEGPTQPVPSPPKQETKQEMKPPTTAPEAGDKPVPAKPPVTKKQAVSKPVVKKQVAESPKPKPKTAPQTQVSQPAPSKLEDLPFSAPAPEPKKVPSNSMVQKIDQLAKLPPKGKQPGAEKPPSAVMEQTLKELDSLKAPSKVPGGEKKKAPSVSDVLAGFDSLKMEQAEFHETPPVPPGFKKQDTRLEELELENLLKRKVRAQTPDATVSGQRELLAKLEALQEIKNIKEPVVIQNKTETGQLENLIVQQMQTTQEVLDKIASLGKDKDHKVEISFDVDEANDTKPVKFQSRIWKEVQPLTSGKGTQGQGTGAHAKNTFVYQGPVGQSQAADPLSKYVGLVHQKIYKNWRNPIGAGHSQVKISFFIFRAGNIDQPKLVQSSGDDQLDKLALLAVKDAAPFPAFPSAIKEPNLHLTINFKYVQK